MQTRQQVFCEIKDHIMLIRVDNPETENGLIGTASNSWPAAMKNCKTTPMCAWASSPATSSIFTPAAAWTPTPRARKTSIPMP